MAYFKSALLFVMLLSSFFGMQAQIFVNKDDIIEKEGYNYESGTTDDGSEYIIYKEDFETDESGKYTRHKIIYFLKLDSGELICNAWKILEPSSETNAWVSYFKDEGYVDVDYMQWKNYESNIIYDVSVEDKVCVITAFYDSEK